MVNKTKQINRKAHPFKRYLRKNLNWEDMHNSCITRQNNVMVLTILRSIKQGSSKTTCVFLDIFKY